MKRAAEAATRQRILEFGHGLGIKLRRTTSYQNYSAHLPMALMAWPTTDRRQWSARRQRGCLGAVRPNRKQASAMLSQLNKGEDWVEPHRPPPTEGRGGRVPANTVELLRKEIYGISSLSTTPPPSISVAASHFRGGAAIAGGGRAA
ncbi:hypothetical protein OPV22_028846 [Ensete ventricosum]|uniref:Uncharacterized protein n=1 Tax=Ensete ventricosum TaxID=4639 RepID=A0AAV8Q4W0_ENSVE|nr:hypothetical protein OPV22_028846 [Ensete ventricosum]